MKLSGFGKLFSITYTDRMSIQRLRARELPDGTTYMSKEENLVGSGIACRISYNSPDTAETGKEDTNPIYAQVKIFCDPSIDIKKGDTITADRLDDSGHKIMSYTGTANLPLIFVTHQEVQFTEVGDA